MKISYVLHNVTARDAWLSMSDIPCPEVTPEYYEESNHTTHEKGDKKWVSHGSIDVDVPVWYVAQGYRPLSIRLPVDDLQAKITETINAYVLSGVPVVESLEEKRARVVKELADVEALAAEIPGIVEEELQKRQGMGLLKVEDKNGVPQPDDKIKVVR